MHRVTYRLGLTLAHQELHQLQGDPKVASAVATHPCTRIVFRVGDDDAKKLADGFESFDAKSLKTLDKFHAIVRVERNDYDFNLALRKPEVLDEDAAGRRDQAIAASRAKYGTPRTEVEAALRKELNATPVAAAPVELSPATTQAAKPVPPPAVIQPPVPVQLPTPFPATKALTVSERKEPQSPAELGRGGVLHQAIQKRIKEAGVAIGFHCVIEKQILDGQGSVDLVLERNELSIACEVWVTTPLEHEIGNVAKCLKAGFPQVVVISLDDERLRKIASAVLGSLGAEAASRVEYYTPDKFIERIQAKLPQHPEAIPEPETSRGYKIKRKRVSRTAEEQKQVEEAALRTIAEAMQKKKQAGL